MISLAANATLCRRADRVRRPPRSVAPLALPLLVALLSVMAVNMAVAAPASQRQPKFDTWLSDGEGMLEAMEQGALEKRPILVYFYTDWCPYCRQFERELLSEDYVEEYLGEIIKVRINPERGPMEAQISRQYGVNGYPAIFVHSGRSKVLSQIQRMKVVNGRPELMSAVDFVTTLKQAAGR